MASWQDLSTKAVFQVLAETLHTAVWKKEKKKGFSGL